MKLSLRRLGFVVLLIVLAFGSWWLVRLTTETEAEFDGKLRHDPDFIVEEFEGTVMTARGKPQYEMQAKRLVHFGDDGSSEIEQPYLIQYNPDRAPLHASAKKGFVPKGTEFVKLMGDVHVAQGRDPRSAGGDMHVETFTFKLDKSKK
jgi:lipopolysaccharide export system protein LptC